jgi:hypothetical protein
VSRNFWLALLLLTCSVGRATAQQPVATAGDTLKYQLSTGTGSDEFSVSPTAGVLLIVSAANAHASADAYLKCTDATTASTTPGTTAIAWSVAIPFGNIPISVVANGKFATAITCYITSVKADTGTQTSVAVSDVRVNYTYRVNP